MPSYVVYVNVEGEHVSDAEEKVTATMEKFGFGKIFKTDDGTAITLPMWLYDGESPEDERAVAVRLRSMLKLATDRELYVLVLQGANSHFAHSTGSLMGIADLDPDNGAG